ncbi:hypothetical protein C8T65DRAFT_824875 [Cerioporus squamosus]|nr:hypothetical protein C8T65DRAFT_824875 [Cerioporus squamosus]
MPVTLYLGTVPANEQLILSGKLDPELLSLSTVTDNLELGNFEAIFMTPDRGYAIELAHREGNPLTGGKAVPALVCKYQLETLGLSAYNLSNVPNDIEGAKDLKKDVRELIWEASQDQFDKGHEFDIVKLPKCILKGDTLEFCKGWDGKHVVLWWLRTLESRTKERLTFISMEKIEFKGWDNYRPE